MLFQVSCSKLLEEWSFQWLSWYCGRVNALFMLPESCHAWPQNAISVQCASYLGYIFTVLVGAQLPVPLSQASRTTGTTPDHWTSLLSHCCPAAVAGQPVKKTWCFWEEGCQKSFPLKRWGNGEKQKVRALIAMKLVHSNNRHQIQELSLEKGGNEELL